MNENMTQAVAPGACAANAQDKARIEVCRTLLRERMAEIEAGCAEVFADWEPEIERGDFRAGAENLAYYLAARQRDLTDLQADLSALGLSSLGRAEAHPRQSLAAVAATVDGLSGYPAQWPDPGELTVGLDFITREQERFFGDFPGERKTRIMVTMPEQGAHDPAYVERLVEAGASCFRINCAHDGPEVWAAMIANIRAAAKKAGRTCPVVMDIAGPKCRIETIDFAGRSRLHRGDRFQLVAANGGNDSGLPAVTITFPHIVSRLQPGMLAWVDDGKIGARVAEVFDGGVVLEVTVARDKGEKLKLEKGMNFPSIDLEIAPLTPKDLADLPFVATHADIVGCSFIQRPEDIRGLNAELRKHRGDRPPQPLLLKIETG
ncbi:MAG: pyruvate kinase, partial [Oricola sp.]